MVTITKLPPVRCPVCGSDEVRKHNGVFDCFNCETTTNRKGVVKQRTFRSHRFYGRGLNPKGKLGSDDINPK